MSHDSVFRPTLNLLTQPQIEAIYAATLEVLESTGVRVYHEEARGMLQSAGARVDDDRVRIPARIVEQAIRTAPKEITVYTREGEPAMKLGGGNTGGFNTYYGTGSDLRHNYDPMTGELRVSLAQDVANAARIVDALPDTDFVMSYGIPSDVPLEQVFRSEFYEMVTNSSKPIVFTSDNGDDCRAIIEMAAAVVGGPERLREKPYAMVFSQPTPPLQHSRDALGKIFAAADAGIPFVCTPGVIPSASGPVTAAGTCVVSLAESLSFLVMHQLRHEGAPAVLGGGHGCLDLKTMAYIYAPPYRLLTEAALIAMCQHFGLPTYAFGGCSDAQTLDEQAGMEFAFLGLWAAMTGLNLAHDTGYLGSGLVGDLRAIVFNDEINSYVRNVVCAGMPINDGTLAVDVIGRVGPGGSFLAEEHTLEHFRTAFWEPSLSNRLGLDRWREHGATTMKQRLTERVREILATHTPEPLSPGVRTRLQALAQK